jgi:hypothetical protein
MQNLVINFAAGKTFLNGKRCTMLQMGITVSNSLGSSSQKALG